MLREIKKNKLGVSVMIGYVLLISMAVIMGGVLYYWMKSYVPQDQLECQDGTSLIVKSYSCAGNSLNLTLLNNGRFNLGGYYIYASNDSSQNQSLATINLYNNILQSADGFKNFGSIIFNKDNNNSFPPGVQTTHQYNLAGVGRVYFVEISPARYEDYKGKARFASCGNQYKIKEKIVCS